MHSGEVAVLLGLCDGATTLRAQLESLNNQTYPNWCLTISDDGSSDHSVQIAYDYANRYPERIKEVREGPRRGFQANFLSMLDEVGPRSQFAAFCDQDDVWLPDKLSAAVTALERVDGGVPAAYCGRTTYCDSNLHPLRNSPLFTRPPSFQNALVQSIAGGNTIVLNRAAIECMQSMRVPKAGVVSHDWWVYQVITGVGGQVIYDPKPQVLYRLHQNNLVGANDSSRAAVQRLQHVYAGRLRVWNTINIAALKANFDQLTSSNAISLEAFTEVQAPRPLARLSGLRKSGVYRQSGMQTKALWFFAALGLL